MNGSDAIVWIKFIIGASIIIFAGSRLSRYGDIIGRITGIGGIWIGVLLLAAITSLPELITTTSSVVVAHSPDLAIGNILGSNLFNLLIITILDFLHGKGSLLGISERRHILSCGFGLLLCSMVVFPILMRMFGGGDFVMPSIFMVGLDSLLILGTYIVAMRLIYLFESRASMERAAKEEVVEGPLGLVIFKFVVATIIIVSSGVWLSLIVKDIAEITGWGETFVGNTFLAISTSLPEIVVGVSAIRMGKGDMALGNIFGSNIFNISIVAIVDLFYRQGPILSSIGPSALLVAIIQIMMTSVVIIGLIYRSKVGILKLGWDAVLIFFIYLFGEYIVFSLK